MWSTWKSMHTLQINWVHKLSIDQESLSWVWVESKSDQSWVQFLKV